jgi:hypothetical protein
VTENELTTSQLGFMKGKFCATNLLEFLEAAQQWWAEGKPLMSFIETLEKHLTRSHTGT